MTDWRHRIEPAEAGERLDRYLQRFFSDLTRSRIKRLITDGDALVDDGRVKAGHPLRAGEWITVTVPPPPRVELEPEDLPVTVVYEDDDLLVVDKEAGMAVHPGAGRTGGTLVNALLGRGTPLSPLGAPHRPGIVHRLDKGTSGLLVVAKREEAHHALSRALAARAFHRRYWALVWGAPRPGHGAVDAALARSAADRRRMRVVTRGGKTAVTRYWTLWSGSGVSALELRLETGRTHQIRAHFKHLGYPVFADPDYGGRLRRAASLSAPDRIRVREALAALSRQALHAAALGFVHPRTGDSLAFTSDLPTDMMEAGRSLGLPPHALQLRPTEEA